MNNYITYTPEGKVLLPNIKKLFLPDFDAEGNTKELADIDLSGADIQVVAADAECKWLLDYFDNPKGCGKVYAYLASEYLQKEILPTDDEYKVFKANYHSTNYMVGVKKIMSMTGLSFKQAEGIRNHYFTLCPEIPKWHKRLESDVKNKGYVENKFGRRMEFTFSRNNPNIMNEVASAIPQSTIGDLINRAWVNIRRHLPDVDVIMQVHDSLVVQYDRVKAGEYRIKLLDLMLIPIPYDPVLYIASDIKVSRTSYGDTKKLQ